VIAVLSKCSSEILSSAILVPSTASAFILAVVTAELPSLAVVTAPSETVVSSPTP